MPIHTPRSRRRVRNKLSLIWQEASVTAISLAQGAQNVVDLLSALGTDIQLGSKILRIVGSWAARPDSPDLDGAIGLTFYLVSEEAFSAAVIPEFTVDRWKYLYRDVMYNQVGDVAGGGSNLYQTRQLDIRPNRRITGEDRLVCMRENISTDAVTQFTLFDFRVLLGK